jgi:hypothetical protein
MLYTVLRHFKLNSSGSDDICTDKKRFFVHLLMWRLCAKFRFMQQVVFLQTKRSLRIYSTFGGFVAELDKTELAGDEKTSRKLPLHGEGQRWIGRIAHAIRRMATAQAELGLNATNGAYELSKGAIKRIELAHGGRILCRTGKVWITFSRGDQDIVLTARQSEAFGLGASVLVEALAESRISLEAL